MSTTTIAPGKLIISGEHSVVYHRPALVAAVNRYSRVEASVRTDAEIHASFEDLDVQWVRSVVEMRAHAVQVDLAYDGFQAGRKTIREVLDHPSALPAYAIGLVSSLGVEHCGADIRLISSIEVGSGMGSSAAISASIITALAKEWDVSISREHLHALALKVERVQHGNPSGADPWVCIEGGIHRFQKGRAERLNLSLEGICVIDTGTPLSTTGETVVQVSKEFAKSDIWDQFELVTRRLENAIACQDGNPIIQEIRENHRLLTEIRVVPERVREFIDQIEAAGGAGKICGAGSAEGSAGGMVMAYGVPDIRELCSEFGYDLFELEVDHEGTRVI